jgi:hypothetical protein
MKMTPKTWQMPLTHQFLSPHNTDDFDQELADSDSFVSAFISPETPPQEYANNVNMTATPTAILLPRGARNGLLRP